MDLASPKSTGSALSIASLFVEYLFVERLLQDRMAGGAPAARKFGSLFLSSFLGSLGILAGLVVLVVPGIYLMARWSISTPLVVVERMNGREALSASWTATRPAQWVLLFAYLAGLCLFGVLFAALVLVTGGSDQAETNPAVIVATNLLTALFMVGGWVLSVAIYRLLSPSMGGLAEVFA